MTIKAKWNGKCDFCGRNIPAGTDCEYDPATKKIRHTHCTRTVKRVALFAKTGDHSTGIATGYEYEIDMVENQQGKFVVHMTVHHCGGTFRQCVKDTSSTPTDREVAEQHYAKAVAFAESKGAAAQ